MKSNAEVLERGHLAQPGTEAWVNAQAARSSIQVVRDRSAAALAEVDSLAIGQNASDRPKGIPELREAQVEIEAIVARQTAAIEATDR